MGTAAAGGWSILESSAGSARAAGLAKAAGVDKARAGGPGARGGAAPLADGLSIGYLPGSAGLFEAAASGRGWDSFATRMRWARWQPSLSLPSFDSRVSVSIGMLQPAQVDAAPGMLKVLEVVAHFALDVAPYFAPFNAWRYESAGIAKRANATSPLTFDAAMPDRVGLQVAYALSAADLAPGVADSGMVYLPLGARDGPSTGLYVLAGPSRYTGTQPDFSEYRFSGTLDSPLTRSTDGTPDFDFVTLAVRAAA
jgi:hypothetical protein